MNNDEYYRMKDGDVVGSYSKWRTVYAIVILLSVVVVQSACATNQKDAVSVEVEKPEPTLVSPEVTETATREIPPRPKPGEYEAAFQRFVECVESTGGEVSHIAFHAESGTYTYAARNDSPGRGQEDVEECYLTELREIEITTAMYNWGQYDS